MSPWGRISSLRTGRNKVQALTLLLALGAGIAFLIQFLVDGRYLAATGAVLACGASMLIVRTVHRTGQTTRQISSQLKALPLAKVIMEAPPAPTIPPNADPEPLSPEVESESKDAATTSSSIAWPVPLAGGRVLALVGSQELAAALSGFGTLVTLHPGTSSLELAASGADTLIVEEAALETGPWNGALEAHGPRLLNELRDASATIRATGGRSYVIAAPGVPAVGSAGIRDEATVVRPEPRTGQGDDAPVTLMTALIEYAARPLGVHP